MISSPNAPTGVSVTGCDRQLGRRRLLIGGSAFAASTLAAPAWARNGGTSELSAKELHTIEQNGSVDRQFEFQHKGRDYLGALSYSGVERSAQDVWKILMDPSTFHHAWPSTFGAAYEPGDNTRIRMHQGTSVVDVEYTILWQPEPQGFTVKYWMDPSRPTEVDDTFGFFRIIPRGPDHSIICACIALDPGSSLPALLFRSMIHDYMVRPARYMARYMHEKTPPSSSALALR